MESRDLGFQLPKFLTPVSVTPQVQGEDRFEVAKIQPKISADLKHSKGTMKTNFFCRTPVGEKGILSCPYIKGVFHKLLHDLNAPVELQNSHVCPIFNETTDGNCVPLQLDDIDDRCGPQVGPGDNTDPIHPSSIKSCYEIVRRSSYSSDGGSESKCGDDNRKWEDRCSAGSLSVEENEEGSNQNLNQALTVGTDNIAAIAVDKSR
ncbi:hypothetical protein AAC387_Pa01g3205 [Persea americana]